MKIEDVQSKGLLHGENNSFFAQATSSSLFFNGEHVDHTT